MEPQGVHSRFSIIFSFKVSLVYGPGSEVRCVLTMNLSRLRLLEREREERAVQSKCAPILKQTVPISYLRAASATFFYPSTAVHSKTSPCPKPAAQSIDCASCHVSSSCRMQWRGPWSTSRPATTRTKPTQLDKPQIVWLK